LWAIGYLSRIRGAVIKVLKNNSDFKNSHDRENPPPGLNHWLSDSLIGLCLNKPKSGAPADFKKRSQELRFVFEVRPTKAKVRPEISLSWRSDDKGQIVDSQGSFL
jgi:hypothetical protein